MNAERRAPHAEIALTWNGENRLINTSNSTTQISYSYDYMGRRFRKVVDDGSSVVTNTFLYDGWNLISEVSDDGSSVTTNHYVWGLDLSGGMQGAGGIGGLLATVQDGDVYFSCFDANGNLTDYVDDTGSNVAHYVYGPFGGTISATGDKADDFSFRFSTKYEDSETGLLYYGYRFYSSEMGRWPSRDPLREAAFFKQNYLGLVHYARTVGGRVAGTYTFCVNEPLARFDSLGLCDTSCTDSSITLSFSKSLYVGIGTLSMNYTASEDRHICGIQCPDCSCGREGHIETTHSGGMGGSWDVIVLGVPVGEVGFSWSMGGKKVRDFNTCTGADTTYGCKTLSVSISGGPCVKIPPVVKFCLICSIGMQGTLCEGQPEQWTTIGGCEVQACAWGACVITPIWP